MLKVCIDTNVWLSGLISAGNPAKIVTAALNKRFGVILSQIILKEIEKNLIFKFQFSTANTRRTMRMILHVADLYEPQGTVKIIDSGHTDNLVLETAWIGRAKYLVTGDKRHLLPLKSFRNIKIVDPTSFLALIRD